MRRLFELVLYRRRGVLVNDIPKYYWFQRGGFTLAVDAVSVNDAREYAKLWIPGAEYRGKFNSTSFPKTACGGTTARRQAIISERMARVE
jgi:hypothetical protein